MTHSTADADPLSWVRDRSPVLRSLSEEYAAKEPFAGDYIAVSAPLTPHTGRFIETLAAGGAEIGFTGEPGSTHQDVVDHLDSLESVTSFVSAGVTGTELKDAQRALLSEEPDLVADDGCLLLSLVHEEFPDVAEAIRGGCEQTTGGMTRLHAMAEQDVLAFPVYGVNDTPMKNDFDNVHGTAESSITNLASITNTMIAGKTAVVVGYGNCGRGLARKLRDLGARTIVTETDPRRALEAIADGHEVTELREAAPDAELLLTATGQYGVVRREHIERLPDGAIVGSIGSAVEIDTDALADLSTAVTEPQAGLDRYHLPDGTRVNLLTDGKVVNLSGPHSAGNPTEVMDTTFAMMVTALRDLGTRGEDLAAGLYPVPDSLDRQIAETKLATMDVDIDDVTDEQREYSDDWERHAGFDPTEERVADRDDAGRIE